MTCFYRSISEQLLESHTMEQVDFLKPIIHSQIIVFSVKIYLGIPTHIRVAALSRSAELLR